MKRGILCCVLAAFLALPALAAAEVQGVYVAPRFLLGIQDSGQLSGVPNNGGSKAYKQYSQAVFGGALAAGFNFAPKFNVPIRTEVEFALRSNSSNKRSGSFGGPSWWESKQTTNLSTLFFNGYFDINTGTPFTPYLGGGLGMAFNYTELKGEWNDGGFESVSKSRHDTTFAWNAGAGVSYAFTENVAADLGYRFIGTGYRTVKLGSGDERMKVGSSPYINEFYLGARFTF